MGEEAFAQWAQLAAAEEYKNDIVVKTNKARLGLVQMEAKCYNNLIWLHFHPLV